MLELIYSLSYILVDIEVKIVNVCVICAVRTVKVWVIFVELPNLFRAPWISGLFLEHLKKILGKEFERFKSCDTAGKSCFFLGTELWGSHYEDLLYIFKSYIIDIWEVRRTKLYDLDTCPLQYQSRPRRESVCQGKGKFGELGGGKSCCVVYGSTWSSGCIVHVSSATIMI